MCVIFQVGAHVIQIDAPLNIHMGRSSRLSRCKRVYLTEKLKIADKTKK